MTTTAPQLPSTQHTRRGGAPRGNTNGMRHGLRGAGLPKGCQHIQRATCQFRRQLESAVFDARGEITLVDASYVNTAYRAERHAQLAQRWLMRESEAMTPADRLNYSREVVRASAERDKAITALNLPKRPDSDPWQLLQSHHNAARSDTGVQSDSGVQVATRPPDASGEALEGDKSNG